MLAVVGASLLRWVAAAAILGVVVAAVVLALVWVLQLRTRAYRGLFNTYLMQLRGIHYDRIGLRPRRGLLRLQVREETDSLIRDPTRTAVERDPMILADIEGPDRTALILDLKKLWARADARWRVTLIVLTTVITGACAYMSRVNVVPLYALTGDRGLAWIGLWGLAGLGGWLLLVSMERRGPLPEIGGMRLRVAAESPELAAARDADERAKLLAGQMQIGGPDEVVRALHLSSGGFDTIMHLGVAHALWVTQGRAPDAIVGISAGAIQGVAVAEVLQAGEKGERDFIALRLPAGQSNNADWTQLSEPQLAELQKARLLARAHRLRHFVEAAQRAPERLMDALVPDTYQINTAVPMRPLEGPRFPAEERRQRVAQLQSISGLTRLYNDLLGVSFSIGTLTRFARRVLGLVAAGDVRETPVRWLIRSVESLRLGLLVGMHLMEVARLLPILLRAFRKPSFPKPRTAGMLLFQSVVMRQIRHRLRYGFFLSALVLLWALVSDLAVLIYVPVMVGLLFYLWRDPEDVLLKSATVDALGGFVWFCLVGAFWTATAVVMVLLFAGALTGVIRVGVLGLQNFNAREVWFDVGVTIAAAGLIAAILLTGAILKIWAAMRSPERYRNRLLSSYDLGNSILTEHGLRAFLVDMFDYGYYSRAPMDRVVDQALKRRTGAPPARGDECVVQKTVGYYSEKMRLEPIHLGLAVADTATGRLEVVPRRTALVDGLLACTAVVPWMPAVELESPRDHQGRTRRTLFIDGGKVSREPTRALLKMLRSRLHEGTKVIHLYSVTPFPVSGPNLGTPRADAAADAKEATAPDKKLWLNLVEIAWRALRLKRFRDATLERRLTEKFSELIPSGSVDAVSAAGKPLRMFRAWVAPVELECDADVNRRIVGAPKEERRRILYEAMADGCRASLQLMMANSIQAELASGRPENGGRSGVGCGGGGGGAANGAHAGRTVKCSQAVNRHRADAPIAASLKMVAPVGGDPLVGPGLAEICDHCCLWRGSAGELKQTLLLGEWETVGPEWPHERAIGADAKVASDKRFTKRPAHPTPREQVLKAIGEARASGRMIWPRDRRDPSHQTTDPLRPTVSLLFSGGVFRGVYQMGVLNALHELGIEPDLIAGASVGSITAAMVADAFAREHSCEHKARIARLASVYLTVDRLVMSDRLADFVRNFTLRAADTRFSIREADRLFRRYDAPKGSEFDLNARNVIAGIERLLYISPYELNRLVRALRGRDVAESAGTLHEVVQQYLNRMQIGDEALGAEALELLIREYVIGGRETENPGGFTVDELRTQSGVQFLATATNLTHGRLDVFGDKPAADAGSSAVLQEVLLASSAFPAVFRPRWSWEAEPGDGDPVQYIDGGVTDNLPLDAVTQFLERAAFMGLVSRSPAAPHLVIAASLEVNAPQYILEFTRRQLKQSWMVLRQRAKALGYNRKLDTYADAQDRMRSVTRQLTPEQIEKLSFTPVNLKVVAIKPDWLCGTFSFHPMLGFQRTQQARSIAHGCAGTLLRFAQLARDAEAAQWMETWKFRSGDLPAVTDWAAAFKARPANGKGGGNGKANGNGNCWLRKGKPCPFSATALREMNVALEKQRLEGKPPAKNCGEVSGEMIVALDEIHRLCPERETHLREI
jgi:predicted acylesterase/phospholipase RssA